MAGPSRGPMPGRPAPGLGVLVVKPAAQKSSRASEIRRGWPRAVAALGVALSGCAGMRSSTRPPEGPPPLLGAKASNGGYPTGPAVADRKGAVTKGPVTATRTSRPSPEPLTPAADDGKVGIALQPPTTAPAPQSRPQPKDEAKPEGPTIDSIVAEARARIDAAESYRVTLRRQERVGGTLQPGEEVLLSIRRTPSRAVRLEWPGGPHKGREVIFEANAHDGKMQIYQPNALPPFQRVSMAPDNPLVRNTSRHPISEAGFESILKYLEEWLRQRQAGDPAAGRLAYEGLEAPDGKGTPCHKVVRVGPDGETDVFYFDPDTKLPASFQAVAGDGQLLEKYRFVDPETDLEDLRNPAAFDPERRWPQSKGLLNRLAGAADAATTTR